MQFKNWLNSIYYHGSHTPLEIGSVKTQKQRPYKILASVVHEFTEKLLERERRLHFPDKPSRLKSIFLAPDLRFLNIMEYPHKYEVKINANSNVAKASTGIVGKIHTWIEQALEAKYSGTYGEEEPDYAPAEKMAAYYWQGSWGSEILVDGSITILREVK